MKKLHFTNKTKIVPAICAAAIIFAIPATMFADDAPSASPAPSGTMTPMPSGTMSPSGTMMPPSGTMSPTQPNPPHSGADHSVGTGTGTR